MDLMDLVSERVGILYEGIWKENQVKILEDAKYLPKITGEMLEVAKERFAARKAKNPKIFDGNAFHLDLSQSIIQKNRLILAVGRMRYSIYDIARKEYADKYDWKELPSGMGTNVVVLTSDFKLVMHNRSSSVEHTAKISTIGGIYGGEHPFENIREELQEELKLEKKEIKRLLLLGIYTRLDERVNHGLSFFAKTTLSTKEILKREQSLAEKEGEIFFLEKDPKVLRDYLMIHRQQILSDGFVGLVLAGRHLWGEDWSEIEK